MNYYDVEVEFLIKAPRLWLTKYVDRFVTDSEIYVPDDISKRAMQILAFQHFVREGVSSKGVTLAQMGNGKRPKRADSAVGWPVISGVEIMYGKQEVLTDYCRNMHNIIRGSGGHNWTRNHLLYSEKDIDELNKSELLYMTTEYYCTTLNILHFLLR